MHNCLLQSFKNDSKSTKATHAYFFLASSGKEDTFSNVLANSKKKKKGYSQVAPILNEAEPQFSNCNEKNACKFLLPSQEMLIAKI